MIERENQKTTTLIQAIFYLILFFLLIEYEIIYMGKNIILILDSLFIKII